MIIDSGYLILNKKTGNYIYPNNDAFYRTKKGAERVKDFQSQWNKNLQVVKVKIVVEEAEGEGE